MQDPGVSPTQSRAHRSNRIASGFLVLALVGFVLFHFLPWVPDFYGNFNGWRIWKEISKDLLRPTSWDGRDFLVMVGFLTGTLVLVSGPFLLPIFRASRLAWWFFTVVSGLATIALSGVVLFVIVTDTFQPGIGMICIVASQFLNLTGLFFIRRPGAGDSGRLEM